MFAPDTQLREACDLGAEIVAFCAGFDPSSIPGPQVREVHEVLVRARKQLDGALLVLAHRVEA